MNIYKVDFDGTCMTREDILYVRAISEDAVYDYVEKEYGDEFCSKCFLDITECEVIDLNQ